MPSSQNLVAGVSALAVTLLALGLTANHLVKSKLRLSLLLFLAYIVLDLVSTSAWVTSELEGQLRSIEQLIFALAVVNIIVVLVINPFRVDRVPERFPNIVQDAIIVAVFLLIATFVLREKLLTTSAVGAVVIGFALQDTLGNMFAGLAIQVEKPFHVGHWITVGEFEGLVTEITWRATKLRTKAGNLVVVPNNIMSKEGITNYSEPAIPTRMQVDVGVSYSSPPNEVKSAILEAITPDPLVLKTPSPEVLVLDFGSSAIVYRTRFWIADYAKDEVSCDHVRSSIYYIFRRRGIEIPFPIQTEIQVPYEPPTRSAERAAELERMVRNVELLAPLSDAERAELVAASPERLYAAGEHIVVQGQPGASMFVICSGRVRVTVGASAQEVAVTEQGGYFGEMSLLTGDPRTATVAAIVDTVLLEITADTFRRIVMANPAIVEQIYPAMETRRAELTRTQQTAAAPIAAHEGRRSLLDRIQEFLGLQAR